MKNRVLNLTALAVLTTAASVASAQDLTVQHYRTRGYTHGASLAAPGTSVFYKLTEYTHVGNFETPGVAVFAAVTQMGPGTMTIYTPEIGAEAVGNLVPAGPSLLGESYGSVSVPARKLVYTFPSFFPTVSYGTLNIEATLRATSSTYVYQQPYHNDLTIPGYGMVFTYTQMMTGRISDQGTGYGSATWTNSNGVTTTLVPAGSPTTTQQFGYIQQGDIVISR
jgi:hypothetical protein